MCGITGMYAFNEAGRFHIINLQKSTDLLEHRGPDWQGSYLHDRVGLGHRRLSVIDPNPEANQPMSDPTGRYQIVFNGEIYNYLSLKIELEQEGVRFSTQSDTEVLLLAYIKHGIKYLDKLNGFFTFAIYDREENELFIARDRFGIKPLYYFQDEDKLIFASELRSVLSYGVEKSLNYHALYFFLQLNYIPAPLSIINSVHKLLPGHYIRVKNKDVEVSEWYRLPEIPTVESGPHPYEKKVRELLEQSVENRLIADVPLGAFLSGGIDSSIITGIASQLTDHLNTFSIGFPDEPFFDETRYSRIVSGHFNTNHTEFNLTDRDLFSHLHSVLDHMDEPFADSSALPVYILSRETKKYATVALSGDGADELFAGYNKHRAFYRAIHPGVSEYTVASLSGLWNFLPQSRNGYFSNKIRQLRKFAEGFRLTPVERYWLWCSLNNEAGVRSLLNEASLVKTDPVRLRSWKEKWIGKTNNGLNPVLQNDLTFMLPNDMLYKVDHMSMAHGLEVRVPFLDHHLVEYVTNIPEEFKMIKGRKKALLYGAFGDFLPKSIFERPKKGFEVPLLHWMRTDLRSMIDDQLLEDNFIHDQGIFNSAQIKKYKKQLFSKSPGDNHAFIWGLIVFQRWWKNYLG